MKDNFYRWHTIKSYLSGKESRALFHEREVWWSSIGLNVGEEIFGKGQAFTRPVLIFKKFTGNSFMALPLTTQKKTGSWYANIHFQGKSQAVILNQSKTMDKKRLHNKIGTLDDNDFFSVQKQFIDLYVPSNSHPALMGRGSLGKSRIVSLLYSLACWFVKRK
jgi:mRNA interferase MazF